MGDGGEDVKEAGIALEVTLELESGLVLAPGDSTTEGCVSMGTIARVDPEVTMGVIVADS